MKSGVALSSALLRSCLLSSIFQFRSPALSRASQTESQSLSTVSHHRPGCLLLTLMHLVPLLKSAVALHLECSFTFAHPIIQNSLLSATAKPSTCQLTSFKTQLKQHISLQALAPCPRSSSSLSQLPPLPDCHSSLCASVAVLCIVRNLISFLTQLSSLGAGPRFPLILPLLPLPPGTSMVQLIGGAP